MYVSLFTTFSPVGETFDAFGNNGPVNRCVYFHQTPLHQTITPAARMIATLRPARTPGASAARKARIPGIAKL